MKNFTCTLSRQVRYAILFFLCSFLCLHANNSFAQFLDQGAITGTVQDNTGAIIPGAVVTLESPDTGFRLTAIADASGTYVFSPIKIGNYTISASAPGFQNAVQKNITLSQGQRLDISPKLRPGAVTETVTVTDAPPLLQTEASSVGQALSPQEIVNTPLNGRNTMFLVQLTPGAAPAKSSRATSSGDFDANGLRPEQNNFVIDGVDNNALTMDFLSGTSYLINPPPDALAEFKVSTSNYSAEFGHSAGAVVSASIKAGTNQVHGALWEYWRNDILSAHDWTTPTIKKGEYRQNQFGATLGFPIIKNKLFLFGDAQANRIVINLAQQPISVPTLLERQGDFSELLNPAYLGGSKPQTLYEPQNNQTKMTCNGVQNVLCPGQISALAKTILNMYPLPNTNNGYAYNNYVYDLKQPSDTFQWDMRMDWDISS
ncbi:MAG: carboxypeptidase-like regulatory domain-containing protein, partial [Formivibrio sp.]|nr:carboxypeptidase-like regulatory domain-containing protein [Formivibrio sp.]